MEWPLLGMLHGGESCLFFILFCILFYIGSIFVVGMAWCITAFIGITFFDLRRRVLYLFEKRFF